MCSPNCTKDGCRVADVLELHRIHLWLLLSETAAVQRLIPQTGLQIADTLCK